MAMEKVLHGFKGEGRRRLDLLYHLLFPLYTSYSAFNVFRYITFRAALAALMALLISFLLGPWLIRTLTEKHIGQPIRDDGPASHAVKAGTPTMGGTLILFSLLFSTLLLADLTNPYVWLALFVTLGFGVIGFVDDYLKLRHGNCRGFAARASFSRSSPSRLSSRRRASIYQPQFQRPRSPCRSSRRFAPTSACSTCRSRRS